MMLRLTAGHNGVVFDPAIGNFPDLWFGPIQPLHKAPWYGTIDEVEDLAPVERRLAGNFLCMPFGKSDVIDAPLHGLTANRPWALVEAERNRAHLRLTEKVMGATVDTEIRVAARAPLLYQNHIIDGGEGQVTLAQHPMIRMAAGGRIAFSPKAAILTPAREMEPGRSIFAPGCRTEDPTAVPGKNGEPIDLTRYPNIVGEDFVTLVERPGSRLGWTAVTRAAENDIVFILKEPTTLPVTMLWFSNGGRHQAPWSSRHRGVLGIEDGIAAGADGHAAALTENAVAAEGVSTTLTLGGRHEIRHVIGAIPRPAGWSTVTRIHREVGELIITGDTGQDVILTFSAGFL